MVRMIHESTYTWYEHIKVITALWLMTSPWVETFLWVTTFLWIATSFWVNGRLRLQRKLTPVLFRHIAQYKSTHSCPSKKKGRVVKTRSTTQGSKVNSDLLVQTEHTDGCIETQWG